MKESIRRQHRATSHLFEATSHSSGSAVELKRSQMMSSSKQRSPGRATRMGYPQTLSVKGVELYPECALIARGPVDHVQ